MKKIILLTGATDGIGFETAKMLVALGHQVLLHGRSKNKLRSTKTSIDALGGLGTTEIYQADLSDLKQVEALANAVAKDHEKIDVLINNAGVFKTPVTRLDNGLDIRFMVNTIAPYLLTRELLPKFPADGRVINLSSAAQAPVNLRALQGEVAMGDSDAYAQSKLAITMWSFRLAKLHKTPAFIAVNPASFLGSKMVKEAYGTAGKDLSIGADILVRAATGEEFAHASGKYFDNDRGQFASPHRDALNDSKNEKLIEVIEDIIEQA
eukprot:Clim_evm4s148 gene=Clim_evmTU4s148